jgi:hypothetical protein
MEKERFNPNNMESNSEDGRSICLISIIAVPKDFDIYKYISPREEINCKQTTDTINLLLNSPYFSMDTVLSNQYLDDPGKTPNFTVAVILDVLDQLGLIIQKVPNYTGTYMGYIDLIRGHYAVVRFVTLNIFALINDMELIETYLERVIKIEIPT